MKPELNPRVQAALFHEALVLWRPSHPQHKEKSSLVPRPLKPQAGFGWSASWHFSGAATFQLSYFGEEESGLWAQSIKALRDSTAGSPFR